MQPRRTTMCVRHTPCKSPADSTPAACALCFRYKSDGRLGELVVMQNKPPKWNEAVRPALLPT